MNSLEEADEADGEGIWFERRRGVQNCSKDLSKIIKQFLSNILPFSESETETDVGSWQVLQCLFCGLCHSHCSR